MIWIKKRPPPPCSNRWLDNGEARINEKRQDSVDTKGNILLAQNILIDNIQDVSKTLVTSVQGLEIKRQPFSLRNFVIAILRGLVLCGDFLKSSNYQLFK